MIDSVADVLPQISNNKRVVISGRWSATGVIESLKD
jgi:hypothetical protein